MVSAVSGTATAEKNVNKRGKKEAERLKGQRRPRSFSSARLTIASAALIATHPAAKAHLPQQSLHFPFVASRNRPQAAAGFDRVAKFEFPFALCRVALDSSQKQLFNEVDTHKKIYTHSVRAFRPFFDTKPAFEKFGLGGAIVKRPLGPNTH